MRYLLLFMLSVSVYADTVVTCSPCLPQKEMPAPTDIVLVGPERGSGAYDWQPINKYPNLVPFGPLDGNTLLATCMNNAVGIAVCVPGLERKKNLFPNAPPPVVFPPPTFTYVPPKCIPNITELRWRWVGSRVFALWYCDTPKFVQRNTRAFDLSVVTRPVSPTTIGAMSKEDLFKADKLVISRPLSEDEVILLDALEATDGIKITVAANGTTLTRPVYAATATNTRGATVTARATVGAPCGRDRLQNTDGTGSMYFAVPGGFTLCKITGGLSK